MSSRPSSPRSPYRRLGAVGASALLVLALAGCGSDDDAADASTGSGDAGGSSSASDTDPGTDPDTTTETTPETTEGAEVSSGDQEIDVTIEGDEVTPDGDRVEVAVGQPVDFVVTADAPGEIHVHSDPEEEFEYDAGTSTTTLTFDRPGVIEVESHSLDKLIVQLQVQ